MKTKIQFLACVFIPFFFIACANDSSDNSSSTVDLFASPKTVIANLDTDLRVSSSTQSARTAIKVKDIDVQNNTETVADRLAGEISVTQCILKMTKKEIAEAIGELKFNEKFEPGSENPVIGEYLIEKEPKMQVRLSHFEVKHVDGDEDAYIYSRVVVPHPQYGDLQFDSVLKCTKNVKGTLDTELFMVGGGENLYVKFTCTAGEKKKKELKTDINGAFKTWDDIFINSDGIEGYKYSNEEGKDKKSSFYVDDSGYSAAVYDKKRNDSREVTTMICEGSSGDVIVQKYKGENSDEAWCYNLNWIDGISEWVIVENNDEYKLKETEASTTEYKIFKCQIDDNKYTYLIRENDLDTLKCKISDAIITKMMNAVDNFNYPSDTPETYITTSIFTDSLSESLSEWISTLN